MQKLIRDRIPELMRADGKEPCVQVVQGEMLLAALKNKLDEECAEVQCAETPQQRLEELGDVFEVLSALAAYDGYTAEDILAEATRKRATKGGFTKGIMYLGDKS